MTFKISSFFESLQSAIHYIPVTLELTIISFVVGIFLGAIVATIRFYKIPVISQILAVFVTVYMGLPHMVAMVLYNLIFMTCYNDFAKAFHIGVDISEINPIFIGYFVLIMAQTCQLSESIRGAFRGIDKNQYEAGYSIGLTKVQTLKRIIFPQMVPILLPGLENSMIGLLKASNLVSAISVVEIMTGALLPSLLYYTYLEGYIAAALVYWLVGICIEIAGSLLEKNCGKFLKQALV